MIASPLPSAIQRYLEDFVFRGRRLALARTAAMACSVFLAWVFVWCAIDRIAHLPKEARLGALAVGVGIVLVLLLPKLTAIRKTPDWLSAAEAVEQRDARFAQRLVTVTSRLLGAASYRGSDDILARLVREVDAQVASDRPQRLIPMRTLVWPCVICAVLLLGGAGLIALPDVRFGALLSRLLNPFSNVPPVTTTQLNVAPGDCDVVQSQPVNIEVTAVRLGDSLPTLFVSDGERNWSRLPMTPMGGDRFSFALAGVERDLRYYVRGGDARSPDFVIRVLRRPVVAQFRIRYEYPAYTRLPSTTVTNADGRVEAPAGTMALLTITATEPLQTALLTVGSDRIVMERLADPHSCQASFPIRTDAKYSIDLISTRNVPGSGPSPMFIRAVPDLPPQVRLARGGDSLRLNPRDIVPVWYEALDDYGLKALAVRSQVNAQPPIEGPVGLWGDRRRQQDVLNFDLATLPLGIGDVVKLTVVATDTAGQTTESQPLVVVVAPRSVDLDSYERIEELHTASQLAQSLALQLDDGFKAHLEVDANKDRQSMDYQSALSRADRAFSSASQTATLLRQSLLRATTRSHSSQLSVALAGWIDAAEIESTAADEAFRESGMPTATTQQKRESLNRAVELGRRLQSQLAAIELGEQAQALLADHQNLVATQKRSAPKDEAGRRRLRETLQRMRQDLAVAAGQIGLDPASGDFENQLRNRIQNEHQIVDSARPVDFVPAAREWAAGLQRDAQQRHGLEGRLSAAAQAEAIRPDADLIRARDLDLASRAAAAIAAAARSSAKPLPPGMFNQFVADLGALQRLYDLESRGKPPENKPEIKSARLAASKAQLDLARIAGGGGLASAGASARGAGPSGDERQREAENLALEAGAAAANHDYQKAATLDQSLTQRLESAPRRESSASQADPDSSAANGRIEHHQQAVQQEMATAKELDDLSQQQQRLTQPGPLGPPVELAGQEQGVADQIAEVQKDRQTNSTLPGDSNDGRNRAAAEVLAAQEQLSAMPLALAAAQSAAASRREAALRAVMAHQAANSAPPDQRAAAQAAAVEADQSMSEASAGLSDSLKSIGAKAAQEMADRLEPFAPETDGARAAILGQLGPALQALRQGLSGDDAGASDQAANATREAIEACQRELGSAEDALSQRDPLVAARWYAKAAADSLSARPPDLSHAKLRQANASAALWRAWDQSIHRAAVARLSDVPTLSAVLDPASAAASGATTQQSSKFAAAREWGRLRPQDGSDVNASMHDTDPAGYEESLKLYFEALGKAQEGK